MATAVQGCPSSVSYTHLYGHGWLVMDGGKMSKSKGNVVDPYVLAEKFGVDALRFFLLRTFPFGSDGNFSNELLIQTINMDLANDCLLYTSWR